MTAVDYAAAGLDPEKLRDEWVAALTLAEVGPDEFEVGAHERDFRVFGGRMMGQAVMAAGRTVPAEFMPHNLHATFYRPGKATLPMRYRVERPREGRSFVTRRVRVEQEGAALAELTLSFGRGAEGLAYAAPRPEADSPETLPLSKPPMFATWVEFVQRMGPEAAFTESRGRMAPKSTRTPPPAFALWTRPCAVLPADPLIHAAALAWQSDGPIVGAVAGQIEIPPHPANSSSLNHTIWWHAPPRFDGWMLWRFESRAAFGARALSEGMLYAADGTLLATAAQEVYFPGTIPAPA